MGNVTKFDQNRRRTKLNESEKKGGQLICFSDIRGMLAERIQMKRSQEMLERLGFTGKSPYRYFEKNPNGGAKKQRKAVQNVLTPENRDGLRVLSLFCQANPEQQGGLRNHPDFPKANS